MRDESGAVAGFFCPCIEITEQVFADRRRAADAERQRRLFEQAPGFITILSSPEHVFEFANAAYRRIFGDRDYIGRHVRDVFPDLGDQGFFSLLDQVYTTGERYIARGVLIRFQREDGSWDERILDFIYEPVRDETNQVTGIFVEGHDVTEGHRAAAALRESEARLRELNDTLEQQVAERTADRDRMWDTSPDLMLVLDFNGIFRRVNRAWTKILGYTPDELIGRHVNDFVIEEDHAATVGASEAAAAGSMPTLHNRYRHKDGSVRWISWVAAPGERRRPRLDRSRARPRSAPAVRRWSSDVRRRKLTYACSTKFALCSRGPSRVNGVDAAGPVPHSFSDGQRTIRDHHELRQAQGELPGALPCLRSRDHRDALRAGQSLSDAADHQGG
ncbi:PAS domain-containing protein [Sphingosinicella sp. BN140058]|uniref:PAS domain-containing protein n=1 Tax=Sphingosinicella sp. BN140058 TaxID=1892855 RepID=UPI0010113C5D|nr:PAS domain S-box protein [Sphingosinicella sp. BN140058]QAY78977.1 PAS domain S-box protein [Sphingosinicella sp. BN140058]